MLEFGSFPLKPSEPNETPLDGSVNTVINQHEHVVNPMMNTAGIGVTDVSVSTSASNRDSFEEVSLNDFQYLH